MFEYRKLGVTGKLQAKEYFIQNYTQHNIKQHVEQFIKFLRNLSGVSVNNEPDNLFCMAKKNTQGTSWADSKNSEYFRWLALSENRPSPTPQLKELASTPLILTIILLTLPGVARRFDNDLIEMSKICSTEVGLYDELFQQWFAFQANKVRKLKEPKMIYDIIEFLPQYYEVYALNLANYVLKCEGGVLSENYQLKVSETLQAHLAEPIHNNVLSELRDTDAKHKNLFISDNYQQSEQQIENLKHLRNGCPLNFYEDGSSVPMPELLCKYIHISLLEYLVSKDVFKGLRAKLNYFIYEVISDEASFKRGTMQIPNDTVGIAYRALNAPTCNPYILSMLASRAKIDSSFAELLLEIVKASTKTSTIKQMSANAMTILVKSGYNFSGIDLRYVQIAGADLRGALLANADLRGANLEGVNLDQSWLTNTQLQGSYLNNVILDRNIIDHSDFSSPFSLYCSGKYLYSSYNHQVVQSNYKSGKIVKFTPESKSNLGYWLFCVLDQSSTSSDTREILLWNAECCSIFRYNLNNQQVLMKIDDTNEFSECNSHLTMKISNSSITLLSYEASLVVKQSNNGNVIRFYEYEDIPVLIVTLRSTRQSSFERDGTFSNATNNRFCFPWYSKAKMSRSFSITCEFVACDVTNANDYGLFALASMNSLSIYSLHNVPQLITEFRLSFPMNFKTVLKFCPKRNALVFLTSDDASDSIFKFVNLNNSGRTADGVEDLLKGDLLNFGIPKSFLFNSSGTMLAIEHRVFGEQQIMLWNFSVINGKPNLNVLNQIINYSPTGLHFPNHFPPQYAFCSNDSSIAYYSHFDPLEITICKVDNSVNNADRRKNVRSEERVDGMCISNDGLYGATLSTRKSQDRNEWMKKNVQIFILPRSQGTYCCQISHEYLYGKFNGTVVRIENIAFDCSSRYLLAVDTDFTVLVFDLQGNLIRAVKLFPTATNNKTIDGAVYLSSFQTANESNFLILMHYRLSPYVIGEGRKNLYEFFKKWDISKIAVNGTVRNETDISCTSSESVSIDKTCVIDFLLNGSSDWLIARDHNKIYIWSTLDMTNFRTIKLDMKQSANDYVTDTKFGPKTGSGCSQYFVVSTLQSLHIFKINRVKIFLYKTFECKNVHRIQCTPNHFLLFVVSATDGFTIRNMRNNKNVCSDLRLWYKIENCKILSDVKNGSSFSLLCWGTQSNDLSLSCFKIDAARNGNNCQWTFLWSYKAPFVLEAKNCNLNNCFEIELGSFKSLQKFGIKGQPLLNKARAYTSFADLFSKFFTDEKCKKIMDPIIICSDSGGVSPSSQERKHFISNDIWLVSVVVKKDPEKCTKACLTPHMSLIIEGINNDRRFVIKAHKQYINKQVIVSVENMQFENLDKRQHYAQSLKAKQWSITSEDGMKILLSIYDDLHREDLTYSLLKKNCVEWCRSKLNIVNQSIGRKTFLFELIAFPSVLLRSN